MNHTLFTNITLQVRNFFIGEKYIKRTLKSTWPRQDSKTNTDFCSFGQVLRSRSGWKVLSIYPRNFVTRDFLIRFIHHHHGLILWTKWILINVDFYTIWVLLWVFTCFCSEYTIKQLSKQQLEMKSTSRLTNQIKIDSDVIKKQGDLFRYDFCSSSSLFINSLNQVLKQ